MTIEQLIEKCLEAHTGKENALTAENILAFLHGAMPTTGTTEIPNTRALLYLIHDMRREGYIIASGTAGYFKPRDAQEAREYLDTVLRSRALDLLVTIRAQRKAITNQFGRQIRMAI